VAKTRVHELAKEFGTESRYILMELKALGEFVKSASSTVEPSVERRLRTRLEGKSMPRRAPAKMPALQASPMAVQIPSPPAPRSSPVAPGGSSRQPQGADTPPAQEAPANETPSVRSIPLHSLSSDNDLLRVLRECKRAQSKSNAARIAFDMSDAQGFYPSIAVPAVAIIQHFREHGLGVDLVNLSPVAEVMRVRNPMEASATNLADLNEPLSRMWAYFDHQQANALTTAFMDCIRRKVECEAGVLEALEWCLYEVLDNVMQHSKSSVGYAMLQLHIKSKRLAVCVSDTGIGVQRSLASSPMYRPRTAFDALTMAVEEGVTRDQTSNQGNGLFGLVKIVEQNGGKLHIRSGRGYMLLQGNRATGANDQELIGPDNHGTTVDFQLKVDRPVSIGNALNYEPTNLFMESLESADGEHVIKIREQAGGAGSRLAARELKVLIMNVLNDAAPHVVLDFEGQAVVSSSFADEVIGKMFAQMGFNGFNQRVKLRHMNPTVSTLVDRAIARRLGQASK
jgi:anti-sigma regulatory factor (Ser/Thr protein kinase)